ncbi:MAG: RND transporter [Draconibacterium sp.]|nr:MAG: RND transporter [Draconibacterium sp.]
MNRKHWLFVLLAIAILIIAILFFSRTKKESSTIITKAVKGPFEVLVYATGQLESEHSENIVIPEKMKDRQTRVSSLTITDLIEEGTYVDSGDYVATLDYSTVEEQIKSASDELEKALSSYQDSKIDSNLTLSNQRDQIVNAHLDLEEREIAVQESAYEAPSIQKKVKMDLDKAERRLKQLQKAYKLKTQQEANKVKRMYITYKQVLGRVQALNELKDQLVIYAPRSGIISYYQHSWGGITQTGSRVSQWNPIIATFPNMKSLITKTFINEIDISLIKKGQKVRIGIDAFPDKELTGEVLSIANMGQSMPKSDAKVFEVKIKIDGSDPELKPAMTTANTIQTVSFEDVVYIPIEAVFKNDSLSFVYPAEGEKIKQIIETGDENENFVIVKQGVTEGEKLFLTEPEDAESFALEGMEIYADILKKQEEKKEEKKPEKNTPANANRPAARAGLPVKGK